MKVANMTLIEANAIGETGNVSEQRSTATRAKPAGAAELSLSLPSGRLHALLNIIRRKLPAEASNPVLHFISPAKGEGADVLAFETAYVATLTGKRVLFIDTKGDARRSVLKRLPIKATSSLNALVKDGASTHSPISTLPGTSLSIATLADLDAKDGIFSDGPGHKKIFEDLKSAFDMIVTYSESGMANSLAAILYGLADGAVLVAEAERTRLPVIRGLRSHVEMLGGRVLGVVLNKRRFHIPRLLYWMLFRS